MAATSTNKRMAVLVGCNYPNTPNELHGCINDVLSMHEILVTLFGFDPINMELLIDDNAPADGGGSFVQQQQQQQQPTGANIMKALHRMVDQAEPGDVLFLHYSGHGTRIPSKHGFRHVEAIVPCDLNLITDVDFRQLVNRLPEKASFTIISDSCHSGGLIDKEKEQIGPASAAIINPTIDPCRPKSINVEDILDHLKSLSGIQSSSDVGVHLLQIFGNEASSKFFLAQNDGGLPSPVRPDYGILLSGCQANETSADVNPTTAQGSKSHGAFSNALQMVLTEENGNALSNKELIIKTRTILEEQGFYQHPCLYCSDDNADTPFLSMPA